MILASDTVPTCCRLCGLIPEVNASGQHTCVHDHVCKSIGVMLSNADGILRRLELPACDMCWARVQNPYGGWVTKLPMREEKAL